VSEKEVEELVHGIKRIGKDENGQIKTTFGALFHDDKIQNVCCHLQR
jgi:hypothetical protein